MRGKHWNTLRALKFPLFFFFLFVNLSMLLLTVWLLHNQKIQNSQLSEWPCLSDVPPNLLCSHRRAPEVLRLNRAQRRRSCRIPSMASLRHRGLIYRLTFPRQAFSSLLLRSRYTPSHRIMAWDSRTAQFLPKSAFLRLRNHPLRLYKFHVARHQLQSR